MDSRACDCASCQVRLEALAQEVDRLFREREDALEAEAVCRGLLIRARSRAERGAARVDNLLVALGQVRDIAANSSGNGAGRRLRSIHRIASEHLPAEPQVREPADLEGQMLIGEAG